MNLFLGAINPATKAPGVVGSIRDKNKSKTGNKTNSGREWNEKGEGIKMETIDGIRTALLSLEVERPHLHYTWRVAYCGETTRMLLWRQQGCMKQNFKKQIIDARDNSVDNHEGNS